MTEVFYAIILQLFFELLVNLAKAEANIKYTDYSEAFMHFIKETKNFFSKLDYYIKIYMKKKVNNVIKNIT